MEKKKKNEWALLALFAGIFTYIIQFIVGTGGIIFMIIAIVCAIVGLVKYKKNPEIGGLWYAIIGIILVVGYVALLVLGRSLIY